jgi:DNA-binding XRE family transcriptional regulator
MPLPVKPARLDVLPDDIRNRLIEMRRARAWTQVELGRQVGLPQVHISDIETGKVVPRFNTLLDLVRVLDYDLRLVPRPLVPAVQALIRAYHRPDSAGDADEGERPLYATTDETEGAQ